MSQSPIFATDFYKTGHGPQYPEGTEHVYSNFTARGSRLQGIDHVVVWFIQAFVKQRLIRDFDEKFFNQPKYKVLAEYQRRMDRSLGVGVVGIEHLAELHDLGYLPLRIKALPEGTLCPIKTPILTIRNTNPRFYWLTNFVETMLSAELWHPMTTATLAWEYRKLLHAFAEKTSDQGFLVPWQGHDFSMRGQTSLSSAAQGGSGHLLSFTGTDTIPAIELLEELYEGYRSPMVGGSVPATEHSVMCLGGSQTERETFKRIITKVVPKGIVSIVSDSWDYWNVVGSIVPSLRPEIEARDGKVVIRPDSGDPVKIVCGDPTSTRELERIGTVEALWNTFGGTVNSRGYKELSPKIGVIYGDSITLEIARQILTNLEEKGFASTNVVFGIGSYTYQHVTRDTFGFAVKATWGRIKGKDCDIFKDPKTDSGIKKSARGMIRVNADLSYTDQVSKEEEGKGMLDTVFLNGKLMREQTLEDVRKRLLSNLGGSA